MPPGLVPLDLPAAPADVLLAALAAGDAWAYDRVVALCDPATAAERFTAYCAMLAPPSLDALRREHPEMSEEELGWHFAHEQEEAPRRADQIRRQVPGVRTHAELTALAPADFLERSLAAEDQRADLVGRLRARGRAVPAALLEPPPGVAYVVLGEIADGPATTYVLYRTLIEHDGRTHRGPVNWEPLRRQSDGAWRLVLHPWRVPLAPRGGVVNFVEDPEIADLYRDPAPDPALGAAGPHAPRWVR